jgi:hypothetical protein
MATPRNKHEIRSFLGLCTYYRRVISGFVSIAKLLTSLTEEKSAFQWTLEVEAAVLSRKEASLYRAYPCLPAARREVLR